MGEVLAAHARSQSADEIQLVEQVRPALERLDAASELDDRGDGADATQLRRGRGAIVARQLQCEIPAERVAGDDHALDAVLCRDLLDHVRGVCREARVIQPVAERLGAAAVALVEQDDVEAAREGLVGDPLHVVRGARSFQAVERDQQRMRATGPAASSSG